MASCDRDYYASRQSSILALFDDHAMALRPLLARQYGDEFASTVLWQARERHEALIPDIPYIGGDENLMTRHLIRSTSNLAFYQAMKANGKTAEETGKMIYDAIVDSWAVRVALARAAKTEKGTRHASSTCVAIALYTE